MCQIDDSMSIDIWNASVNRTETLPPYTAATIFRRKGLLSSSKFSFELAICRASSLEKSAGFVLVGTALLSKFLCSSHQLPSLQDYKSCRATATMHNNQVICVGTGLKLLGCVSFEGSSHEDGRFEGNWSSGFAILRAISRKGTDFSQVAKFEIEERSNMPPG